MYILGIFLAISAGCTNNIGVLLQKKVINDHLNEPEFLKSLIKSPLWVLGLLLQILIGGAIFYMFAQLFLGPALVPGLMSSGMIVLAIGSIKILNETLKKEEIIGILLMISGIVLISISQLSVEMSSYNVLDQGFILRLSIFTCIYLSISSILMIFVKKIVKGKGVILALISGFIYSLTSVWIGPMVTIITHLFGGILNFGDLMLFIPALIIIILATMYGIIFAQKSFKEGQANILSPLIGVPGQITPVMAFFLIFMLTPPYNLSIFFITLGLLVVITSTFLLVSRQVKLDEIKKEIE